MSVVAGTPRARALAAALRKAREAANMSGRELARRMKVSQALVSHWETARRVPKVEDVAMVLVTLGTEPDERERLLDLTRSISEPNWLAVGIPGVSQQLAGAIESERAASSIVQWSPSLIPGLLQTPEYTQVILTAGGRLQADIGSRLMIRMGRREVLERRHPVQLTAIIGEAALRDPVVEPDLMAQQLSYLIEWGNKPHIDLHIVRSCIGWHPGSSGPFVLYEFPDSGPVVHFEHWSSGAFVPDADNIRDYYSAISLLKEIALSTENSMDLITQIMQEWKDNHV